ncbi:MAG: DUF2493 domain-containing protein [Hyphomicrobiales bacterium]|nr:DUF2493 domain-containing protein [Hyphomicrobiales bacterium]
MTFDFTDQNSGAEPSAHSTTARLIDHLALYGGRDPHHDHRPVPDDHTAQAALSDMFDALAKLVADTRLEDDLDTLLWPIANTFHTQISRLTAKLDANESAQRRSQADQDGSEVMSVELEQLITDGEQLTEILDAYASLRDQAAKQFEAHTGSAWRPRTGSLISKRGLTAAIIDSRDFLASKRRAEIEPITPIGTRIAVTGGVAFNDHRLIWDALDRVKAKHADIVLLHGGASRGAEFIAARWADHRHVTQIVFKPDWTRHGKAAPFKRNDVMLETLPTGIIVFGGAGVAANLADKAKALGLRVWRFADGG